jgi:phenylacetate-coenzyme A ligase PaaK-like adenylate-forming protein
MAHDSAAKNILNDLLLSQWRPAEELRRRQLPLIEAICRFAATKTPFYRGRLDVLFEHGDPFRGRFSMERWSEIEPVTRADLHKRGEDFYVPESEEIAGPSGVVRTSGSTGEPLSIPVSKRQNTVNDCLHMRRFIAHHVDPDGTLALITRPLHEPLGHATLGRGWHIFSEKGLLPVFDIRTKLEEQYAWLRTTKARYLAIFSSVAGALARYALDRRLDDVRLDVVFTQSDQLSEAMRADIEQAFGARVVQNYGAEDAGALAFECRHGALHTNDETAFLEIVDGDNKPVAPSEEGKVLVTSFGNFATPAIRYAVGDFAVRGAPCVCRRGLATIACLLGRKRNLLRFADGSQAWLSLNTFRQLVDFPYRLIQFVQTKPDHIEIHYVPADSDPPIDREACERALRSILHSSLAVTLVKRADIPRGRGGKLDETVSLVDQ